VISFFQVLEEHCCENPFSNLRIGQKVRARIVAEHSGKSGRSVKWELSVKPSVLNGMLYQTLSSFPFHIYATASFLFKYRYILLVFLLIWDVLVS
jgi:hypothetical protein